jgi:hypothetical protein
VNEFAAALARWMGVGESDLATLLPNYKAFQVQGRALPSIFRV